MPLPAGVVRVEDWCLGPTGADGVPNVYRGFTGTLRCRLRRAGGLMAHGYRDRHMAAARLAVILESRRV
jgi:hypothetical protein